MHLPNFRSSATITPTTIRLRSEEKPMDARTIDTPLLERLYRQMQRVRRFDQRPNPSSITITAPRART